MHCMSTLIIISLTGPVGQNRGWSLGAWSLITSMSTVQIEGNMRTAGKQLFQCDPLVARGEPLPNTGGGKERAGTASLVCSRAQQLLIGSWDKQIPRKHFSRGINFGCKATSGPGEMEPRAPGKSYEPRLVKIL